jgi:hypothetical protein
MYKKKQPVRTSQPGMRDLPGSSTPVQVQTQPAVQTQSVSIVDQIMEFGAPARQLEHSQDEVYQTYYANQVSGVKRVGVPYTI